MEGSIASLIVLKSDLGGRGVFANGMIGKGAIVEISPVLVVPPEHVQKIHETVLHDFYFIWGDDEKSAAIALGLGSLFNHAVHSNLEYAMDFDEQTIEFVAIRDIAKGEELTINYNGDPGDESPLWFNIKK